MVHATNAQLVERLAATLKKHGIHDKKIGMEAYMRNQFVFFGVQKPVRAELVREFIENYTWEDSEKFLDLIKRLWIRREREFKYVALDVSRKYIRKMDVDCVSFFEALISMDSWWDTVDSLAPQVIGALIKDKPDMVQALGTKWIDSPNFWYQRSALILQLMYKDQTNFELLVKWILRRADSQEFFVQKAAGWALRQYAKCSPAKVKAFIRHHPELPGLTRREGLKHLS